MMCESACVCVYVSDSTYSSQVFTNLVFKICEFVCAHVCVWLYAAACAYARRGQERASDPQE